MLSLSRLRATTTTESTDDHRNMMFDREGMLALPTLVLGAVSGVYVPQARVVPYLASFVCGTTVRIAECGVGSPQKAHQKVLCTVKDKVISQPVDETGEYSQIPHILSISDPGCAEANHKQIFYNTSNFKENGYTYYLVLADT